MDGAHHLLHHHHHHHLQQQPQQQQQQHLQQQLQHPRNNAVAAHDATDRFPQWSIQETKEFLAIRAELDQAFMETKRNKQLWEVISGRMKEKGYHRSADQCKCKWKNLATRYKGCETTEGEALRQQFPFYNELQSIFTARMERMLWAEAEGGSNNSNKKKATHLSSEDEDEESVEGGDHNKGGGRKSKKVKKGKAVISGSGGGGAGGLKEVLEEFMRQQTAMEAQWMEAYEARESERRTKEMEWRQAMEALEKERAIMEQRWREREEQRRLREEARADRRDALVTALLNKLSREEDT